MQQSWLNKLNNICANIQGRSLGNRVRVYTVHSFSVIQIASLKTKKEHYIRFSIWHKKNEKRLQTNYHRFPNIIMKTKNGTTNRFSFRCIRTKNEMRLQRNSFFLFRFRNRAIHCCGGLRIRSYPSSATAANPNIVT